MLKPVHQQGLTNLRPQPACIPGHAVLRATACHLSVEKAPLCTANEPSTDTAGHIGHLPPLTSLRRHHLCSFIMRVDVTCCAFAPGNERRLSTLFLHHQLGRRACGPMTPPPHPAPPLHQHTPSALSYPRSARHSCTPLLATTANAAAAPNAALPIYRRPMSACTSASVYRWYLGATRAMSTLVAVTWWDRERGRVR